MLFQFEILQLAYSALCVKSLAVARGNNLYFHQNLWECKTYFFLTLDDTISFYRQLFFNPDQTLFKEESAKSPVLCKFLEQGKVSNFNLAVKG